MTRAYAVHKTLGFRGTLCVDSSVDKEPTMFTEARWHGIGVGISLGGVMIILGVYGFGTQC